MRKLILASTAILALSLAAPAYAQTTNDAAATVGGTAGAATGGAVGFVVGGPIGAIIGGFAGAVIGAETAVSINSVKYAGEHPVDRVFIEGNLDVGTRIGANVVIHEIPDDPGFGYIYANNRVYIVDRATGEIVYSPGYLISEEAVAYVEANPSASVVYNGELVAGAQLDGSVTLSALPNDQFYSYAYLNDRPVLVDNATRTVVWIR